MTKLQIPKSLRIRSSRPISVLFLCCFASIAIAQTPANPGDSLKVVYPGMPWTLKIDAPGFTIKTDEMQPDGRKVLQADNDKTEVNLSVTLNKVNGKADINDCQKTLQERTKNTGQLKIADVNLHELNGIPVLEYLVPEASGIPVRQHNFFACMVKDDVYVDLHLSKVLYQPQDERLFTSILDATHFDTPSAPKAASATGGVRQLLKEGDAAYMQGNFAGATAKYQEALDQEKKQPVLDQAATRLLIDNLGTAYGVAGALDKALETFDYGLSKYPNDPMFDYDIAGVYGRKKEMQNAIAYLQKAADNKANVVPGEKIPDPLSDNSFASFKNDAAFLKAAKPLSEPAP